MTLFIYNCNWDLLCCRHTSNNWSEKGLGQVTTRRIYFTRKGKSSCPFPCLPFSLLPFGLNLLNYTLHYTLDTRRYLLIRLLLVCARVWEGERKEKTTLPLTGISVTSVIFYFPTVCESLVSVFIQEQPLTVTWVTNDTILCFFIWNRIYIPVRWLPVVLPLSYNWLGLATSSKSKFGPLCVRVSVVVFFFFCSRVQPSLPFERLSPSASGIQLLLLL